MREYCSGRAMLRYRRLLDLTEGFLVMRALSTGMAITVLVFATACSGDNREKSPTSSASFESAVQAAVDATRSAENSETDITEPTLDPVLPPSPTSTPEAVVLATSSPEPTATIVPTSTPEKSPEPTETPIPTPTRVPSPTATPAPPLGNWIVDTSKNPLDDSATAIAILDATNGEGTYGDPVSLILRCDSGEIDAYISWESYIGLDDPPVTWRLGSFPAQTTYWGISTDSQATFFPGNAGFVNAFLRDLRNVDQFVAQITPYSESPITAIFDLEGIQVAADLIESTCDSSS